MPGWPRASAARSQNAEERAREILRTHAPEPLGARRARRAAAARCGDGGRARLTVGVRGQRPAEPPARSHVDSPKKPGGNPWRSACAAASRGRRLRFVVRRRCAKRPPLSSTLGFAFRAASGLPWDDDGRLGRGPGSPMPRGIGADGVIKDHQPPINREKKNKDCHEPPGQPLHQTPALGLPRLSAARTSWRPLTSC